MQFLSNSCQIEALEHRRLLSADLVGQFAGHLPAVLPPGGASHLAIRVTNRGDTKSTSPLNVQLFASVDNRLSDDDLQLATVQKNVALKPRAKANLRLTFATPMTLTDGQYYLLARLNGAAITATVKSVNIQRPFSDLAVTFAKLPSQPIEINGSSSGKRTAAVKITNLGNALVRGVATVHFYLSPDGTLDDADPLLAVTNAKIALKSHGHQAVKFHVAVPGGTVAGGYFLFATITADGDVSASNNVAMSTKRVAVVDKIPRPIHIHEDVNYYSDPTYLYTDYGYDDSYDGGYVYYVDPGTTYYNDNDVTAVPVDITPPPSDSLSDSSSDPSPSDDWTDPVSSGGDF